MGTLLQELGGNAWWFDRFLSQHIAIFYYFMTAVMYTLSPRMACKYYYLGHGILYSATIYVWIYSESWGSLLITWFLYVADHFSECVENHAFETYDKFIKAKGGLRFYVFLFGWILAIIILERFYSSKHHIVKYDMYYHRCSNYIILQCILTPLISLWLKILYTLILA